MDDFKISGYRAVWLFAMFDLPVKTDEDRNQYTRFRKELLKEGFMMLQFSVYVRYCGSEERAETFRRRLSRSLPPGGEVRLLTVTDRQFGSMLVFESKKKKNPEAQPEQLMFF